MSNNSPHSLIDTLECLRIEDLKERLELSPLLAGVGGDGIQQDGSCGRCWCRVSPDPEDPPLPEDGDGE